jgi:hypothetical protein
VRKFGKLNSFVVHIEEQHFQIYRNGPLLRSSAGDRIQAPYVEKCRNHYCVGVVTIIVLGLQIPHPYPCLEYRAVAF